MGTLINNVAYSWSMIELTAPTITANSPTILNGVSAIKWKKERKVEDNYGLGSKKVSRGFGNETCTASITMDYNTQVQLRNLQGSLMNLGEFDLVISFSDELGVPADQTTFGTETVTLKGCFFSEDGMESSQDDTNITMEFDLHPFDIVLSEAGQS